MNIHKGLSTTFGILIITVAILVVGVAIYFVYQRTQTEQTELSITADDRAAVEVNKSIDVKGVVTASDTATAIQLSIQSPHTVSATILPESVTAGGSFTLTITGKSTTTDAQVIVMATQGSQTISHTVSTNVFVIDSNNPTINTSNTNTATNTSNTNSSTSQTGRFVNGDLGFSMDYPDSWGAFHIPELKNLKPVIGEILLVYFANVNRFDIPGLVGVTAVSANYSPVQWSGTPLWFAGTIDPFASTSTIEAQIRDAGFSPYEIRVVELDGRKAVKMFSYRGLYSHYLDVVYLIPYQGLKGYSTIMLTRSIEKITENEKSEADAIELGKTMLTDLKNNKLSEQAMRRFTEFETAVQSITFTQ
ncbi:MAG: hypothetical protein WC495_01790 [Patescibacteria group bacterium]